MTTRYKAFISYSHKDQDFALWLHRALEKWSVPRDLVGRKTPVGAVPKSLRPIFRDRDDFAGGHSLKEATAQVLADSEFLVVICSPNSAKSQYVNEEVRLFKMLGRADRVIPVILAGEPGDPHEECFPDAVKYSVTEDGKFSEHAVEPIAPDARDKGDGKTRAMVKIVAGLLGVAFDEIVRRAEASRRRRNAMIAGGGTGAFLFATLFASFALYQNYQAGLAIDRSVFSIGSIIQTIDSLNESTNIVDVKNRMQREECDLIEGLSKGRTEIGLIENTICRSEQARTAFERGERQAAFDSINSWLTSLRNEFEGTKHPSYEQASALTRAVQELLAINTLQGDSKEIPVSLPELLEIVETAAKARPEIDYIRGVHEEIIWSVVNDLESKRDWRGSFELMRRASELRKMQTAADYDGGSNPAGEQQAFFLRRMAWLAREHLKDSRIAIIYATRAVKVFNAQVPPQNDGGNFLYQKALAFEVLADAQSVDGALAEARENYSKALVLCREVSKRDNLGDEMSNQIAKEIHYLQSRMAVAKP